jgi:hypothetical protein
MPPYIQSQISIPFLSLVKESNPAGQLPKLPTLAEIGLLGVDRIPSVHQETEVQQKVSPKVISDFRSYSKPVFEERNEKPTESSNEDKIWQLVKAAQYLVEKHGQPKSPI